MHSQSLMGVVTDAATGQPMYLVSVQNERTKQGTTTDQKGLYTLPAQPGDIVVFTFVGYNTVRLQKPTSVLIATQNVTMYAAETELKEFTLRPGLTKYQRDSIERQQIYKLPLQRTRPQAITSPASAIAELFSKKAKRVYAFQKTFAAGEMEKYVDTRYTPELVTKLTGITGDTIGHFMYAYPMPYDFARSATDLELKMWIRSNYKAWMKK